MPVIHKRRRLCMCSVCGAGPLQKLSNHLAQVHSMNPKERSKDLGQKRVFATPEEIWKGRSHLLPPPRKSQRLITIMIKTTSYKDPDSDLEIVEPPSPPSPPKPSSPTPTTPADAPGPSGPSSYPSISDTTPPAHTEAKGTRSAGRYPLSQSLFWRRLMLS